MFYELASCVKSSHKYFAWPIQIDYQHSSIMRPTTRNEIGTQRCPHNHMWRSEMSAAGNEGAEGEREGRCAVTGDVTQDVENTAVPFHLLG
jgi:hypothetical protein